MPAYASILLICGARACPCIIQGPYCVYFNSAVTQCHSAVSAVSAVAAADIKNDVGDVMAALGY